MVVLTVFYATYNKDRLMVTLEDLRQEHLLQERLLHEQLLREHLLQHLLQGEYNHLCNTSPQLVEGTVHQTSELDHTWQPPWDPICLATCGMCPNFVFRNPFDESDLAGSP